MKLKIYRNNGTKEYFDTFEVKNSNAKTVLQILKEIKKTQDNTLSFRHSCASGICGSCAVRVNGTPVLACTHVLSEEKKHSLGCKPQSMELTIEPIDCVKIIKDLVTDESIFKTKNAYTQNYLKSKNEPANISPADMKKYQLQSTCIECASCYSICPVMKTNPDFLGPFILTKTWRYISDSRESYEKEKIESVQKNGVWDCILCGDCATVCPQDINPKMDITFLQTKSSAHGHTNPYFDDFSGGFGSFSDFTPTFQ